MARPRWEPVHVSPADLHARIDRGDSAEKVHAWLTEHGEDVALRTVATYAERRRLSKGVDLREEPAQRVGRAVRQATPDGDEAPIDHAALLRAQLRAAERLSKEESEPRDRVAASKLVLQLGRELRDVERSGGANAPQVHFYFPEKVRIEMCEESDA